MAKETGNYKNFLFFLLGNVVLVFGVMLVLLWWQDVVILFRGVIGMVVALAGLLMLYIFSQKNK